MPGIWKLFKTSKEADDHRLNIARGMHQWSQDNGIPIDRSIYLSKESVEDIIKMRFNPVGMGGTLSTCEKGVSNMLCLPRNQGEIEALKLFEQAVEETQGTRTLKEAERLANSTKRDPPTDYHTLKLMVATFAALLEVLFGKSCDLFKKVMAIYEILDYDIVFSTRAAYTPIKCKQITWAIYEDARNFFFNKVSPLDFATGSQIRFDKSMLDDIMSDVRYMKHVERPNFPWARQDRNNVYVPSAGLPPPPPGVAPPPMSFLSQYANVFGNFGVPPPPPPPPAANTPANSVAQLSQK